MGGSIAGPAAASRRFAALTIALRVAKADTGSNRLFHVLGSAKRAENAKPGREMALADLDDGQY